MRVVFRLPDVGEGIAQADIVEYLVGIGDLVRADQPVVRVETDKAVVELPSPVAGRVVEIPFKPGETANVGDPLLIIEAEGQSVSASPSVATGSDSQSWSEEGKTRHPVLDQPISPSSPTASGTSRVLATPHTRRLARELTVNIAAVKGSGSHGRITDEDVRNAASEVSTALLKAPTAAAVQAPSTAGFSFEKYGPTRRVPLKGVRKRIAEVMVRSVSTIPHVTHFDEADVTELMHVVEREKALAESRKIRLTILSFLAKAAAASLKVYQVLNSSLDEETGELVFKDYIHVGMATDTDAGLMVPVVRDVDKKSILQIASELQELSRRARDRTIDLDDLRGGTFTITNIGAIGGHYATPIILHPQVAILCSMRAQQKPVVREGRIVVRTVMPLTLSFDHRVLDGADAARFMHHLVDLLEDPMRMLVDVA
jgi:pyruvate dehydrogenase E2 component (dihydrolipoamide acetyltransferase)